MKAFKKIALTLFISSAIACSGLAQDNNQLANQLAPQKDRGKKPERPVEKRKNDDRGGDRGDNGKRDDGGKRGKRPD